MFKSFISLGLAAALVLGTPAAWAQQGPAGKPTAAKPDTAKVALARQYFEAIKIDRQLDAVLSAMGPMMAAQLTQELSASPTAEQTQTLGQLMGEVNAEVMRSITPRYLDKMAVIAADTFTQEELTAMVAFYSGPVGRSITDKSPQMAPAAAAAMEEFLPEIQLETVRVLCAKIGCKAPPARGASGA